MTPSRACTARRESGSAGTREEGSALASVVALVVVLSLVVGAVLAVEALHARTARQARHHLQARLSAEEGLARAMAEVEQGSLQAGQGRLYETGADTLSVEIGAFGGFLLVRTYAVVRRSRHRITALLGMAAPEVFDEAVVLTDRSGGLTLADTARITGSVRVGSQGLQTETLGGRPFRGRRPDTVAPLDTAHRPAFDPSFLTQAVATARAWSEGRAGAPFPVVHAGRQLSTTNTPQASSVVILDESATVTGPLRVPPFTVVIASGALSVEGAVEFDHTLVIARESLRVGPGASGEAQLLAGGPVRLTGPMHLTYPSLVASLNPAVDPTRPPSPAAALAGAVRLDGLLLGVWPQAQAAVEGPYVELAQEAIVRGAVVSAGAADVRGRIYGTLIAHTTRLYQSPALYVGWLAGVVIDRPARPAPYLVPYGFGTERRPRLVARLDDPA